MRTSSLIAAVTTVGLLLAGCSADMEDAGGEVGTEPQAATVDSGGDVADEEAAEDNTASDGDAARSADDVVTFGGSGDAVTGRQLARTASVVLEVEDVEQAATRVAAAAQRAGGFVSDAEVRGGDFGSGFLRLRVPARALDATVEDLASIGVRVVESSISTEDLTDQLTDLQARIDNLERLEQELQALLGDVRDGDPQATQLLQVFERLNEVRGEIERLEAQRAGAQDRVALATINVELLPRSTAPEEVEPEPEGTFAQAWQATQDAFGAIADGLIWLGVTILPVTLVVLGIPALLIWALVVWLRRRSQGAPPTPPMAADQLGDSPPPPPPTDGAPEVEAETSEADAESDAESEHEPVR